MSIAEKLSAIAANEEKVFGAGKTEQYNTFWDNFQQNGNHRTYSHAFKGVGWNDNTFKPKYDLIFDEWDNYVFHYSDITDLKSIIEKHGITFDTSAVKGFTSWFYGSKKLMYLPPIDMAGATACLNMFGYCSALKEVDLSNLSGDVQGHNTVFQYCGELRELRLTNCVFGTDGWDFRWSTLLSKESIEGIINSLSQTTAGLSITISKTAKENAFSDEEWASIISTRPNWTVVLA